MDTKEIYKRLEGKATSEVLAVLADLAYEINYLANKVEDLEYDYNRLQEKVERIDNGS